MATSGVSSVDEYLAGLPDATRAVLQEVRAIIRAAIPGAEEVISYRIPAFTLGGKRPVLWFAGWKEHYSLYPVNGEVVRELAEELSPYELAKGTARFPLSKPVPKRLIQRIAKLRAREAVAPTARTPARGTTPVPAALRAALAAEPRAKAVFDGLPPSHRGAYARWIVDAKRADTRNRRASDAVQMLLKGQPPH